MSRCLHPGPVYQGLIAFVIYLVTFVIALGLPIIGDLSQPRLGQNWVDPNFYIWAWRWWPYAITHLLNPLYSHQIGAPAGYSLAWATTSPAVALLVSPITVLFGPIVSFNLTILLAPPASAWAAFVVARRLTGQFWPALFAGPVYGFCVYEIAHDASGQPNLTVTLLLPLVVYLIMRWWDGSLKRNAFVIWLTVVLALEFYTFVEAFTELTILFVVGLVIGFFIAGRALWPKVAQLGLLAGISYVGAVILASPYLIYALQNYQGDKLTRQLPMFSLDFSGLVLPRVDRKLGMSWWGPAIGHDLSSTAYVGIPLLVILVALVAFNYRDRLIWMLAASFVVVVLLAAGPNLIVQGKQLFALPWSFIWRLPLLRSAEPVRFIDFGYLALSMVLALWLAQATKSKLVLAGRWALGVIALAAIFADLPTIAATSVPPKPAANFVKIEPNQQFTTQMPSFFADGTYKQYIEPGETIVVVSHRGNAGMLFQAYTDFYFNIGGGFINASLSNTDALPPAVEAFLYPTKQRGDALKAYVKKAQIGAIIVERNWSEVRSYNFGQLGWKSTTVGGVTIFKTGIK